LPFVKVFVVFEALKPEKSLQGRLLCGCAEWLEKLWKLGTSRGGACPDALVCL